MKFPKFLLLILLFIFTSFTLQTATSKPHNYFTDLESLLAFKSLADPNGILDSNWTTNTTFCSWIGVQCSSRRQRVTVIRLRNFSLQGTISPHLGNLSFLSHLDLANNTLSGHIPEALSQLHRLTYLNLQSNNLFGPILLSFAQCQDLQVLSLASNRLTGSIPAVIGCLPKLTGIYLGGNELTGTIPISLGNLTKLIILDLSWNNLTGVIPRELGNLPNLQILHLGVNNLIGQIPASLSNDSMLYFFGLNDNKLSGSIPVGIGTSLPNLTTLYLDVNKLTGTIPNSLGNLTKLIELDLSWNNLTGVVPRELGNLPNLQFLHLGYNNLIGQIPAFLFNDSMLYYFVVEGNKLSGSIPVGIGTSLPLLQTFVVSENQLTGGLRFISSLSNCKGLQVVEIGGNKLEGALPNSIGNLSNGLQFLVASKNNITGNIPAGLGNLTSLIKLNLYENELTGTIPSSLTRLHKLQGLYLNYNRISGSIPFEIGIMKNLGVLSIGNNAFSGPIPDSLSNISMMQQLFLGNNQFSSSIPQSLWALHNLLYLDLSMNTLSGSIPLDVRNLKSLDRLDVSMNHLSGNISSALGTLQMLTYLDLSRNLFKGEIPKTLDGLISVTYLNLSHNFLTGVIPNSIANLSHLNILDLSFNKLEGKVPNGRVFSNLSIPSLIGNKALCGAPQLHLTPCSVIVNHHSTRKLRSLKYVLPLAASGVILLTSICLMCAFYWRRKAKTLADTDATHLDGQHIISHHELVRATDNFSEAKLLGRGGFGSVYRGCLNNGLLVAIKVLNLEVEGASKSFDAECQVLRMVRHRNLLKIISVCSNLNFKALVLQFMSNGSLEQWLYSDNCFPNLIQRLNIMVDVSLALEYLHHHHQHVVLHCDLKPTNVLLDEEMVAHVSDFGIAKLLLGDRSVASASMPGTIGYIAPEYTTTGTLSRMGDVYSFGILLLETFTGKKPTDSMFAGESNLREWVSKAHPTAIFNVVDYKLLNGHSKDDGASQEKETMHQCLKSIIELGLLCSSYSPKERIPMANVAARLQKIREECLSNLSNLSK